MVATTSNGGLIAMDESGQPLDLSGVNSWSRRIGEVKNTQTPTIHYESMLFQSDTVSARHLNGSSSGIPMCN